LGDAGDDVVAPIEHTYQWFSTYSLVIAVFVCTLIRAKGRWMFGSRGSGGTSRAFGSFSSCRGSAKVALVLYSFISLSVSSIERC